MFLTHLEKFFLINIKTIFENNLVQASISALNHVKKFNLIILT